MVSLPHALDEAAPPQLFVHCAAPGAERASERALLLARRQDVVCVSDEVDPAYLRYLAELGLGPAAENVVPASRFGGAPGRALWARLAGNTDALRTLGSLVRGKGPLLLQPSIGSAGQFALAAAIEVAADTEVRVATGDPCLVEYADQRHHIRARAIELGIPVAEGEVVELPVAGGRRRGDYAAVRAAVERYLGRTGRVIVRGTRGTAGSATYLVGSGGEDVDGLVRRLARRTDNRIYLVEVMVPAAVSPQVQLHVAPRGGPITCLGVTDQRRERLPDSGGTLFPTAAGSAEAMVAWATLLASSLQAEGYAGLLGCDFVEYLDPSTERPRTILTEASPWVSRAIYPLALRVRLNALQARSGRPESDAFVSGTIECRPRSFIQLRAAVAPLLYSSTTGSGLVLYNVGALSTGRFGVVVLGASRDEVLRSYGELQTWLRRME